MKVKHIIVGLLTALLFTSLYAAMAGSAHAVELDGEVVAVAKNKAAAEVVLNL